MLEKARVERQGKLDQIIYSLALTNPGIREQDELECIAKDLREIYKEHFRHRYSAVFPIIDTVLTSEEYDAEVLSANLCELMSVIESGYESQQARYASLYQPISKLIDHVNLELARLDKQASDKRNTDIVSQNLNGLNDEVSKLQSDTSEISKQLKVATKSEISLRKEAGNATKKLKEATVKLDKATAVAGALQTQMISILSIFAAVIIAFSGGISFLGSALTSVQNVPLYKSVIICTLCGLILFNVVFSLIYLVGKLIGKSIFAECSAFAEKDGVASGERDCTVCQRKCCEVSKLFHRLPYICIVNMIGLAVIGLAIVIFWYYYM